MNQKFYVDLGNLNFMMSWGENMTRGEKRTYDGTVKKGGVLFSVLGRIKKVRLYLNVPF